MTDGKNREYDTFEVSNKCLQTQVLLLRRLVKQFTDIYERTVLIASIGIFNDYYEGIRVQLKRLAREVLFHLQEQSKELKLKVERSVIKIEWKETR